MPKLKIKGLMELIEVSQSDADRIEQARKENPDLTFFLGGANFTASEVKLITPDNYGASSEDEKRKRDNDKFLARQEEWHRELRRLSSMSVQQKIEMNTKIVLFGFWVNLFGAEPVPAPTYQKFREIATAYLNLNPHHVYVPWDQVREVYVNHPAKPMLSMLGERNIRGMIATFARANKEVLYYPQKKEATFTKEEADGLVSSIDDIRTIFGGNEETATNGGSPASGE